MPSTAAAYVDIDVLMMHDIGDHKLILEVQGPNDGGFREVRAMGPHDVSSVARVARRAPSPDRIVRFHRTMERRPENVRESLAKDGERARGDERLAEMT